MAALYANDTFRLHIWLNGEPVKQTTINIPESVKVEPEPNNTVIESTENENVINEIPIEIAESPAAPELVDSTIVYPPIEAEKEKTVEETGTLMPDGDENIHLKPFNFSPDTGKENPKGDFVFEPFHTVDYFASQGIKVEKGSDTPLDRQVKSFTEWLKSMKKLSYQPAVSYSDPLVERQARSSLATGEVVTEAMAEVWAKQGQIDKAEAVFMKLKLLHPEKSHYFAARLKDLKENS
jgi:hypothetical protein